MSEKYKIVKITPNQYQQENVNFDVIEDKAKSSRQFKKRKLLQDKNLDIDDLPVDSIRDMGEKSHLDQDDGIKIEPLNMVDEIRSGLVSEKGIYQIQQQEKKKKVKKSLEEDFGEDSDDSDDQWFKSVEAQGEKGFIFPPTQEEIEKEEVASNPFEALSGIYDILEPEESVSDALIRYGPVRKQNKQKTITQSKAFQEIMREPNESLFEKITDLSSYLLGHGFYAINTLTKEDILTKLESIKSKSNNKKRKDHNIEWIYKWSEDSTEVHGPFDTEAMRQWLPSFLPYGTVVARQVTQRNWMPIAEIHELNL